MKLKAISNFVHVWLGTTNKVSNLFDHILTTFPERVSHQGIIDVGLSDH